jgi:hypothetical protein
MRTWVDNEVLDADDANWLSDHIVDAYTTVADRSAGIPAPHNGQLAYVSGEGLTMFSGMSGGVGGDWKRLVPIPAGGTTGQVLAKASDSDFDVAWVTPT